VVKLPGSWQQEEATLKILQKLWHLAKELQLNPQDLRNEMWLSKDESGKSTCKMAVDESHVEILEEFSD